jgi:tetratricopeptide (TPR) repeat protein
MQNNRLKVTLREKILLMLFGFTVFLAVLEIGLRLGGFMFSWSQENRNRAAMLHKGTYRILCVGESTTAGQYPSFLERILNERNIGIQFSVIDKGTVATTTGAIVTQLESYLDTYKPDMVVAMIGINDYAHHMPRDNAPPNGKKSVFTSLKIYKLARLLIMHLSAKIREIKAEYSFHNVVFASEALSQKTVVRTTSLAPAEEDAAQRKLIQAYRKQGKVCEAAALLAKAIERNPTDDKLFVELGWTYRELGRFWEGIETFKKAVELNPRNDAAFSGLGWCYLHANKREEAIASFSKAVDLNPDNDYAYEGLGQMFRGQNKYAEAALYYERAIAANPRNDVAYVELAWCYTQRGKLAETAALLKSAVERNPDNDRLLGGLVMAYEEMGEKPLARQYYEKMNALRRTFYAPVTKNNYRVIKNLVGRRGIRLACVQYPARSIEPLKEIFDGQEGIIFVDNERIFKEAIKKSGYNEYFRDNFGGDFGHCTDKGNELLAKNIADTILQEAFGK